MRLGVAAIAVLLASCELPSSAVSCDFGTCSEGYVCDDVNHVCILPDQRGACDGKAAGDTCQVGGQGGTCINDVCLFSKCGDGILSGAEQCDGEVFASDAQMCTDIGYYEGGALSCNANCTFNIQNCSRYCGDGIKDAEESCDGGGEVSSVDCVSLGFYEGTATCSAACTLDYSTCARCGDGELASGEVCEVDHPLDAMACLTFGFDYGQASCVLASCGADLRLCEAFGFSYPRQPDAAFITARSHKNVWMVGTNDAYVIGSKNFGGAIRHWNGAELVDVDIVDSYPEVISGRGNYAVAAGSGSFVTISGTTVTEVAVPNVSTVKDVYVLGPDSALVVDGTSVYRFNGTTATEISGLTFNDVAYLGVWGASADDVWIGGRTNTGTGVIIHIAGTIVTRFDVANPPGVTSGGVLNVWGSSANDIYFVGEGGHARHWTGGTTASDFKLFNLPLSRSGLPANLRSLSVDGTAADDVRITDSSSGDIFVWDGIAWATFDVGELLDNIQSTSSSDGSAIYGANYDALVRTGSAEDVFLADTPDYTGDVAVVPGAGLYAANEGSGVYRYTGTAWSNVSATPAHYVWGAGPNAIVAVSDYNFQSWNGTSWTLRTFAQDFKLVAGLVGVSATSAYTMRNNGDLYHFDGTTWTLDPASMTLGVSDHVQRFGGTALDNLWLWREDKTIWQYDGTSWVKRHNNGEEIHEFLSFGKNDTYVIGGFNFGLQHWNGTSFEKLVLPSNETWATLDGTGPNDLWVAGLFNTFHWDGTAWRPVRIATTGSHGSQLVVTPRSVYKWYAPTDFYDGKFQGLVRRCPTCI